MLQVVFQKHPPYLVKQGTEFFVYVQWIAIRTEVLTAGQMLLVCNGSSRCKFDMN